LPSTSLGFPYNDNSKNLYTEYDRNSESDKSARIIKGIPLIPKVHKFSKVSFRYRHLNEWVDSDYPELKSTDALIRLVPMDKDKTNNVPKTKTISEESHKPKEHGNTIVNKEKRSQVIDAAKITMEAEPANCTFESSGEWNCSQIAKIIYDNAPGFWPNETDPPVEIRTMTGYISDWLNEKSTE